jgi:hypothetical protein
MLFTISHMHNLLQEAGADVCHRVHAAGTLPNDMNRFLHSNSQEVLFVI